MPDNTSGFGSAAPDADDSLAARRAADDTVEPSQEELAAGEAAHDATKSPLGEAPASRGTKVVDVEATASESSTSEPTNAELAAREPRRTATTDGEAVPAGGVKLAAVRKGPDRTFFGLSLGAGIAIIALVAFVGIFLVALSVGALAKNQANFFTSMEWQVSSDPMRFGIFGLLWTTTYSSVIALVLAVPVAIGVALLITQYLRGRVANLIGFLVDLLAAVPSIIYGLWGIKVLGPALLPLYQWLGEHWGSFPLFEPIILSAGNLLTAGLVLAIMILPIITAITRDVFAQTPRDHIEAALALGATRWEVIKTAVLPYGRSGLVAASMLGLGRALGETVAVMIILSATKADKVSPSLLQGGETFASRIASAAGEFDDVNKTGAYIAAGLVLFVVTFIVNAIARTVAERGKAKS